MDQPPAQRIGAAAAALWWTILAAAIWMTVAWLVWLAVMHIKPGWVKALWGGDGLDWDTYQLAALIMFGTFKLLIWVAVMVALWLTLWARRLRSQG
jgi:hypothetical protein